MECVVIRAEEIGGKVVGARYEIRELSVTAAENLSEVAVVVSLNRGIGGAATVYEDRVARMALVNLEDLRELAYRDMARDGRNGWVS